MQRRGGHVASEGKCSAGAKDRRRHDISEGSIYLSITFNVLG